MTFNSLTGQWDEYLRSRLSRRDMLRRSVILGLSAPVVAGLLAACGGDDDDDGETASTATSAPATSAPATSAPAGGETPTASAQTPASTSAGGTPDAPGTQTQVTGAGEGTPGGTLTITYAPLINHLDVHTTNTSTANEVAHYHYETLFDRNEEGVQNLLVRDAEVSDDGLTHTWTLHDGVMFHDGTPCNAEAVKWNLDRKINEKLVLYDLIPWDTVEAVDETTLEVTLTQPSFSIFGTLATKTFSIYSPSFFEEVGVDGIKNQASGTGPFKIDEYIPTEILRMSRNEDYWQDGLPYLDEVIFRAIPDLNTRATMIESGEADISLDLAIQDVDRLKSTDGVQVFEKLGSLLAYITMNNAKPPLDDVAVRQAINYAVDKQGIIDAVFLGTYAQIAKAVYLNETIDGYVEAGSYDYDPDRARQMLDEAGWVEGSGGIREKDGQPFTINIYTRSGVATGDIEIVELVQAMLGEVGINLEVVVLDSAAFLESVTVEKDVAEYNMVNLTFRTVTGDAEYVVQTTYATDSAAPRLYNRAYFSDAEVDALIAESEKATTMDARNEIYAQIIPLVFEKAPILQLFDMIATVVVSERVQGVYFDPASINWPAKYAWIEA